ncbi:MAG: UvrD-helicase domain-containing protein [Chlamydiae bacterium]|nr:UvrD-helicase domain-containing protein [Chlamydiota bacterium]
MQRFDCLSTGSSLNGPHLLEASAGTGKTFAVEQNFVRLILESSLEIEQILVITFTRAATRELKDRIRSSLEKALSQLEEQTIQWDYLLPFSGEKKAKQKLLDAISAFDRSQIFTIHGFCRRMLKEFAFEANVIFSSKSSDEPSGEVSQKLKTAVFDFLLHLPEDLLCPEQLGALCRKHQGVEKLSKKLLRSSMREFESQSRFSDYYAAYTKLMEPWTLSGEVLKEDFHLLSKNYKTAVKGRFARQIEALSGEPTQEAFRFLLEEEGSLFDFLSEDNRKIKWTPIATASESFFAWGQLHLKPLIAQAMNRRSLFQLVAREWSLAAKRLMSREELQGPDAILQAMHEALGKKPLFLTKVRAKYEAAIIDEFQDTDLLQWDIFRTLFLEQAGKVRSVFLVGDPKQSIYRFRKADIYTYLQAKNYLDPSHHYHLDTNFRSAPALIEALNVLFEKPWLHLPKKRELLPYHPVRAGAKGIELFCDEKGAIHFFATKEPNVSDSESFFFSFIAKEILRLRDEISSLSQFAALVKDRYQAARLVEYLEKRKIPALTKSHLPLGETFGFRALYELFYALIDPKDLKRTKLVLAGPFARMRVDQIPSNILPIFFELKAKLEENGLFPFFQMFFSSTLYDRPVLEMIALQDAEFSLDFFQAVELLLEWERAQGFSLKGLERVLRKMFLDDLEDDERMRRRAASDDEAVQVMTVHVSKGLEFDVVFALGLITNTPEPEEELEEIEAEKLRQLYVAMTRAKRRLYVPIILDEKDPPTDGTSSPMELFFHRLREGDSAKVVFERLQKRASVTWEILSAPSLLDSPAEETLSILPSLTSAHLQIVPSHLHSFTSLASSQLIESPEYKLDEGFTLHTLPRGTEMGLLLHALFEDIFSSSRPLWRLPGELSLLAEQRMKDSKFAPWAEVVQSLIVEVVQLPFLAELEPKDVQVEMEFLFQKEPHFIKGFIDLAFRCNNRLYFLDWKSNWLGKNDEAYDYANLEKCMKDHDYKLQASLYAEALKRAFPSFEFGGAYYLFLRGIHSITQGIFFVEPRKDNDRLA